MSLAPVGSGAGGPRVHPYTPVTVAACLIVLVLAVGSPVMCAVIAGAVAVWGLLRGPRQRRAVVAAAVVSVPAAVGFALMYVPFGADVVARVAPAVLGGVPVTSDGAATAGRLTLRVAAVVVTGLVLAAEVDLDRLMRALQPSVPAPVVYVVGSVVRLLPMARDRWRTIRNIQAARGVPVRSWRSRIDSVLPLVVGLVDDAAQRSRPLQRTGVGTPGPRTVLRPVPNPVGQRVVRWGVIVATVLAVVVTLIP
ncbi:energy-coupling factor transporter transmembrane component T family protein [Corynebacterium bovis]|uniref:energy-coupling factor transporter transmembrane component T family protein n=1 Tax=Corynebacterium bovis TaxID=36808 RepID=UPI000F6454A2|nr:energy-coupling factor transporter transmembrane component T [Corynebacterium bovis]RRQ15352.1 ABC transporter permease [Corynebacterium bovis]